MKTQTVYLIVAMVCPDFNFACDPGPVVYEVSMHDCVGMRDNYNKDPLFFAECRIAGGALAGAAK